MIGFWIVPTWITFIWLLAEWKLENRSSLPISSATAAGLPMATGAWLTWGLSWFF